MRLRISSHVVAIAALWAIALLVLVVSSWRADAFCRPGGDQATCYQQALPAIWAIGIAIVLTQLWIPWARSTSPRARAWLQRLVVIGALLWLVMMFSFI
jgi:hypothetical protein